MLITMPAPGSRVAATATAVPAPEVELLLGCARRRLDPETAARVRALAASNVNWRFVLGAAEWHGVAPLVFRSLEETCPGTVPGEVRAHLRACFDANALNSLRLTARLEDLLGRLAAHGIPAIPYKGPTLALAAYGSLLLRAFGDLDLLVPPEEVGRARDVLLAAGYRAQIALTEPQERTLVELRRADGLVDPSGVVVVELHAAVTPRHLGARVDHARLREHLETLTIGQTTVPGFAPEALLLVLCLHGAKHGWRRLLWICDVAELIRARPNLDWNRVTALARAWGVGRMLRLGVTLAVDLLGACPPGDVRRQAAADPVARALAVEVRGWLFRADRQPSGALELARFHLRALEAWRDRLGYCRFALRPSEADWGSWALPAPLRALYYPLRALRLLVRGPGPRRPRP